MRDSKKVGVVAVSNNNYGSQLQTFAMHYALNNLGVENEVIRYKQKKVKQLKRLLNPSFFSIKGRTVARDVLCKARYPEIDKGLLLRKKEFERFKNQNVHYSALITSREGLEEYVQRYKGILLGSDQVWHPANLGMDYFTLSFVPDIIPTITYAPSFGVSEIPQSQIEETRQYLRKIDSISVREKRGAEIVKKLTGKDVPVVCDPTALLTKADWDTIRRPNKYKTEKYIFCYFLGANPSHRAFAEKVKELTGYKIIALQHLDEFVKSDLSFGDIKPYDIGPDDFISLIADAQLVLTDSFHGTMFSIYYHKDFFTFSRFCGDKRGSTNSRIASILEQLGINDRWLSEGEDPIECLSRFINWEQVDAELAKFRATSISYLEQAINNYSLKYIGEKKSVDDITKELCTGCTACMVACPVNAIKMCSDEEGFKYPSVDKALCINCGICIKTCPVRENHFDTIVKDAYAARINSADIRQKSSSGGLFTALAESVIKSGGVVIGAAFNDQMVLEHIVVDKIEELDPLRASKYVQSDLNSIFEKIKKVLEEGRKVLFCGTPCQTAGLNSFLNMEYENLLLVDMLCYGVPSPGVFKEFISYLSGKHSSAITEFAFRDKTFGYASPNVKAYFQNGDVEEMTYDVKSYTNLFFKGIISRPSCSECRFKGYDRVTDMTLGDYWEVGKTVPDMDDDSGATLVLVHSRKGIKALSQLADVSLVKISFETGVRDCGPMLFKSIPLNADRFEFFKEFGTIPYIELANRYAPESLKNKLANIGKPIMLKTGIIRFGILKKVKKAKIKKEKKDTN